MVGSGAKRLYSVLEGGERTHASVVQWFVWTLILANVVAVILETVEAIGGRYARFFAAFEAFSVVTFTVEYVLRIAVITQDPKYATPFAGRVRFAVTPLALIDLVAILPAFLSVFFALDLRFVRVLRLLRVFKLTRHSAAFRLVGRVVRQQRDALVLALAVVMVALVFISSVMWLAEHEAQPDKFSSIPAAMWWGAVTITTVGYGDVAPITNLGRALGTVFVILGIAVFALPIAIISSGFVQELERERSETAKCPHCGKRLE